MENPGDQVTLVRAISEGGSRTTVIEEQKRREKRKLVGVHKF